MVPFVPQFIPNLLQVAPFVIAFSILCAKPLRKYAGAFYLVVAIAVCAVSWPSLARLVLQDSVPNFVASYDEGLLLLRSSFAPLELLIQLLTSAYTGVCLYLIVMFIGCFEKTPLVKKLFSIRSEISVLGGIIILGHVVRTISFTFLFLNETWVELWGHPAAEYMFVAAVIIGPLLTICFFIPWLTSFKAIRRRMKHRTWKKTQILAYPFMALMVAQGFFLALGHALYGYPFDSSPLSTTIALDPQSWMTFFAQEVATAWMYVLLGVSYLVLRLRKRAQDKKEKPA